MTRTMHDAISANFGALPPGSMRAGYVTGTPGIQWTAAQLATAAVTIDQGSTGSPVASAIVRDVEPGAWAPAAAVQTEPWTPARPTIYCNRSTLPAVLSAGWKGDLWLAIPGWTQGQALPAAPGCLIVAVQNQLGAGNGAYDISTVLDPTWPQEADMAVTAISGFVTCSKCGSVWYSATAGGNVCPAGGQHADTAGWAPLVQLSGS